MIPASLPLKAYMLATWAVQPIAPFALKRRLRRGKELPSRWREKLGVPTQNRPDGKLVWLHAVGLGETLALRGLVDLMAQEDPKLNFLITSGTRTSAEVLADNMPPRCQHQFLPLDTPRFARRFLNHWRPDLAIWAEQEVWPGLVFRADRRGIPLAMVNARLDDTAYAARRKARAVYADILQRFALISAQDDVSAWHLEQLGAPKVRQDGSLKPVAPPLSAADDVLRNLQDLIDDRPVFLVASSHPEDEAAAMEAARDLPPDWITVCVPRNPERAPQLLAQNPGTFAQLNQPKEGKILIDDRFGTLGAWYRIAKVGLIGGSFSEIEGHNPWEAAALGTAVIHGPRTANFRNDYAELDEAGACYSVKGPEELREAIVAEDHAQKSVLAAGLVASHSARIAELAADLTALMRSAT